VTEEFEWTRDHIFPSFIYTRKSEFDLSKLKKEILNSSKDVVSVAFSNRGGLQSEPMCRESVQEDLEFYKLFDYVEESARVVFAEEGFEHKIKDITCWVNINNHNDYNVVHTHGASALCGIFYVSLPDTEDTGLEFSRSDGAIYIEPYSTRTLYKPTVAEGTIILFSPHLMHYVVPNKCADPRISVAFNIN
jgi:uncharacterized protein (TIGR02466 family)